jgi:glycosyltransferase involved in cell wall biosynthesis
VTAPLYFFPDYSAGNPYQAMLHSRLDEVGAHPVPVRRLISHLRHRAEGPADPGVLSLHWTGPILAAADGPFRAMLLLRRFSQALEAFLDAGGRLVWTVHNVLPHETRHRWAEIELCQLLADRADLVHVISGATLEAVEGVYRLDPAKVVLIEHSSYLGYYLDEVTRAEARQRLGLAPADTVLLALGGIRPYKGLDLLLDVLDRLGTADQSLRLLVAGRTIADPDVDRLRDRCLRNERVVARFDHVPDDELQIWMRAADLAVLPYRSILNSGTFLLAQTFGLPVVGPRAGAVRSWEGESHVRLFDPGDPESLAAAIEEIVIAVRRDPGPLREQALAAAQARPPVQMAGEFARAIAPLLSGPSGGTDPPPPAQTAT